ncbi:MAG: glycosyltransferase family A protein, partial [Bacteroidota bacterium]
MISILIPVYNFDVTQLVSDLQKQANQLTIPIEILVFDDGSTADFKQKNRSIQTYPIVNYKELLHNLGRSAIRNALTKVANFPYLLFMDGDSKVVRVDYLKK